MLRPHEDIALPAERLNKQGLLSAKTFEPIVLTLSTGANAVGRQASSASDGAIDAGGQLVGTVSGL